MWKKDLKHGFDLLQWAKEGIALPKFIDSSIFSKVHNDMKPAFATELWDFLNLFEKEVEEAQGYTRTLRSRLRALSGVMQKSLQSLKNDMQHCFQQALVPEKPAPLLRNWKKPKDGLGSSTT